MFGKPKIQNTNVWKTQKLEFQCLEKAEIQKNIPVFGKAKNHNSNLWKSKN